MAKTCTYQWSGSGGRAEWSFDGDALLLTPEDGAPFAMALKECAGISGDGYALTLRCGDRALQLARLGQDGPTLLEQLRRLWPPARARALRLSGSGEPRRFAGALATGGMKACEALLYEDCLLVAAEGEDLKPVFLALQARASFDEAAYAVSLLGWDGGGATFAKLAGRTQEFLDAVKASRSLLAKEAADLHARHLPTLGAAQRAVLSSLWLPGRMMTAGALEKACAGFLTAFASSWLGRSFRKKEGEALLDWAGRENTWLGYGRLGAGLETTGEEEASAPAEGVPPEAAASGAVTVPGGPPDCLLWLLCRRDRAWLLETLSEKDHATYRFEGGTEMTGLASHLLCAPQFSREALYLPLEALTGERADLAIAAHELPFLKDLRSRFRDRVIHSGFAGWKEQALKD